MLRRLEELSNLIGVSGDEGRVRRYIKAELANIDGLDMKTDAMGNLIVHKAGKGPKVMVAAHMDEVGMIVIGALDNGLIAYGQRGIDSRVVVSKRVLVGDEMIEGVIGAKAIHLQTAADRKTVLGHSELFVDIGAKDKDDALKYVKPGDRIGFATKFKRLGEKRVMGKALDDRVGCAILMQLLANDYECDFYGVFTVQEEVGLRGMYAAAYSVAPDVVIVLEGTTAADIAGVEPSRRVCVLGGGPAGLEAARVAALRGHDVTLFEKTTSLGGQLNIACVPPRKEEMRRAAQDLIHAVCNAGVHLCMGQTRTAEQLKDAGFEAVINAVGAHSAAPRIPGIDSVNVADAWKVLAGEQQVYGTVAVIGGGMVGCETAEYLAARGCKVSVIEMMDKIAAGESTTILPTLLENYKTYGVEQYPSHKVKEFRMDAVVCENKDGAEVTIPCDYIVLAMGARSNGFDAAALEAANIPVYSIGDAAGKAADISNAIRTGYDTACQL